MSRVLAPIHRGVLIAMGAALVSPASGVTFLFNENFDGVPRQASPTYRDSAGQPLQDAFSLNPPSGWDVANQIPGFNDPNIGVPEWKGWSIARKGFWQNTGAQFADRQGRQFFEFGQGGVAVADPDQWNTPQLDFGDPANRLGYFNAFLQTPILDLSQRDSRDDQLKLAFDTSWLGECCDDGQFLDPSLREQNNQTAIVRARVDGGSWQEVFRWESAPFRDANNRPTLDEIDDNGTPNTPNPFFVPFSLNERVFVDLQEVIDGSSANPSVLGGGLSASASSGGGIQVEFGMEDAGDDGWWAIDNIEMASYASLFGDMNLSGALDVGDYDAFALGLLDTYAYRVANAGAFPAENGSLDSVFDYDDIPAFLAVMEGVGAPATAFAQAFFGAIPEPSTAALVTLLGVCLSGGRRPAGRFS